MKGKRAEASKVQAEQMENPLSTGLQKLEISEANTVQKFKSKPKSARKHFSNTSKQAAEKRSTCYNCGFDFPHTTGPCPARGKTCGSCKRKNHFTRCCKSKPDGKTPQNPQRVRKIEATTEVSESSESSDDDYVFYMDGRNKKRKLEVSVKINQENVKFLLDTGASINIIDENSWQKINSRNNIQLKPTDVKVYAYGATKSLEILGQFESSVETDKIITVANFYVAKHSTGNLMTCKTAEELSFIKVNVNKVESETTDQFNKESPEYVKHLQNKYKDVFKGLGQLKDFEVTLHENSDVKPIVQQQGRIPFHVREKVTKELEKLEAAGIIEPVEGPTDWVSPIVIVPKKNSDDIRICVDMRQPNTAILRTRHPMPTTDDLITELNGATIFSYI